MSNNNYIAVKRIEHKNEVAYAVWVESANNDIPNPLNKSAKYFKTKHDAINFSNEKYSAEHDIEYGIVDLDDEIQVAFLKKEMENNRKKEEKAVNEYGKEDVTIFNMNLHELILVRRGIYVLKVSNGWLYKWGDSSPEFVPDTTGGNIQEEVDE